MRREDNIVETIRREDDIVQKVMREDDMSPVKGLVGIPRHIAAGLKTQRAEELELVDEGSEVADVALSRGYVILGPSIELVLAAGAGGLDSLDGVTQLPPGSRGGRYSVQPIAMYDILRFWVISTIYRY